MSKLDALLNGSHGTGVSRARKGRIARAGAALVATCMLAAVFAAPSQARLTANPSPPDFYLEITGGYLQIQGGGGAAPLGLSIDFKALTPPLPNPSLRGTVDSGGNVNIPKSGVSFAPLSLAVGTDTVNLTLEATQDWTGKINPLSGRVDFVAAFRIKASGVAQGQSLGNNCFLGSAGNPLRLNLSTHIGASPNVSALRSITLAPDGATLGGAYSGEAYSDEAGIWAAGAVNDNLPFKARSAGSFRGVDDTFGVPAASGCGPLNLADGPLNDQLGLPAPVGGNRAVLDIAFVPGGPRTGSNVYINKGVKANFSSPLVSSSWPAQEIPTLPTSVVTTLNGSGSTFAAGANAAGRYEWDLGTGTFEAPTNTASQSVSFATAGLKTIRLRVKDADGDVDVRSRQINVVESSDISIGGGALGGEFRGGSAGTYVLAVTNNSSERANTQPITVVAPLPSGVSFVSAPPLVAGLLSCSEASGTVTCDIPQGSLAAGATRLIIIGVNVDANASNPTLSSASVSQLGDPNATNDISSIETVVRKTDLEVHKSHGGQFVANGFYDYAVEVKNVGDAPSVGTTTVVDTLPAGMTFRSSGSGGDGWSCASTGASQATCTTAQSIAPGANTSFALRVKVAPAASGTLTNSVSVSTNGDTDAFSGSNAASDPTEVVQRPDLAVEASHNGAFTVGTPESFSVRLTNESVEAVTASSSLVDTLPNGITVRSISGSGWDCASTVIGGSTIDCGYAQGLAPSASTSSLTIGVNVDHPAYPGVLFTPTLVNADDAFSGNDTASDATDVRRLDIQTTVSAVRDFSVGVEGQYRLNVNNVGDAATVGAVKIVDDLPASLKLRGLPSGAGWDCSASLPGAQHIECDYAPAIAAGSSAPVIAVRVDVLDQAAEDAEVVNVATANTLRDNNTVQADSPVSGNNSGTATTKAVSVDLAVTSRHGDIFRVGQSDEYSVRVTNVGAFGTRPGERVTVVNDVPEGMTIGTPSASRSGWFCQVGGQRVTCTKQAASAQASAIPFGGTELITIPVTPTFETPRFVENVATVATLKDDNVERSPNNRSTDATEVRRIDLRIFASIISQPRAGGTAKASFYVRNEADSVAGTAATVAPTVVTVPLANGVSYRPAGSTMPSGWVCSSAGAGISVVCRYNPSIAAGASTGTVILQTSVAPNAPASWHTRFVAATEQESPELLVNNFQILTSTLERVDLALVKSHPEGSSLVGGTGSSRYVVSNVGNHPSSGAVRVVDTVDPDFTILRAYGDGWVCSVVGRSFDCRSDSPAAASGELSPLIVTYSIAPEIAGTRNSRASLTHAGDPFPTNNWSDDPTRLTASADLSLRTALPATLRVGDTSSATFRVSNNGAEATAGSPAARLEITLDPGLIVGDLDSAVHSADNWNCEAGSPIVCRLSGRDLAPGQSSSMTLDVSVAKEAVPATGMLAHVFNADDINSGNDSSISLTDVVGVDLAISAQSLQAAVKAFGPGQEGQATRFGVNIENVGTDASAGRIRVELPLSPGEEFVSDNVNGPGWSCQMSGSRVVVCDRDTEYALPTTETAPQLLLNVKPKLSNAPTLTSQFSVAAEGDINPANNSFTRNDPVLFNPDTTISVKPAATTTSKTAEFTFASDDPSATFECSVDAADYAPCTSPLTLTDQRVGGHAFAVRAVNINAMKDLSPAEAQWAVTVPSGGGNAVSGKLTAGTLGLATLGEVPLPADQISFAGQLSAAGVLSIPQNAIKIGAVEQLVDAPGIGQLTAKIILSATGPGQGILTPDGGAASLTIPLQAKLEVKLGAVPLLGPASDCYLRPIEFDLDGTYNASTKSVTVSSSTVSFPRVSAGCGGLGDTVNNLIGLPRADISVSLSFDVAATEPPQTTLVTKPAATVASSNASFGFSSTTTDATFECKLDNENWKACSSPNAVSGLALGRHTFSVRAVNSGGTPDATPESHSWTVVKPVISVLSASIGSAGLNVKAKCTVGPCAGSANASAKVKGRTVSLGTATYSAAVGKTDDFTIRLSAASKKLISDAGSKGLAVALTLTHSCSAGASSTKATCPVGSSVTKTITVKLR